MSYFKVNSNLTRVYLLSICVVVTYISAASYCFDSSLQINKYCHIRGAKSGIEPRLPSAWQSEHSTNKNQQCKLCCQSSQLQCQSLYQKFVKCCLNAVSMSVSQKRDVMSSCHFAIKYCLKWRPLSPDVNNSSSREMLTSVPVCPV